MPRCEPADCDLRAYRRAALGETAKLRYLTLLNVLGGEIMETSLARGGPSDRAIVLIPVKDWVPRDAHRRAGGMLGYGRWNAERGRVVPRHLITALRDEAGRRRP